MRDFASGNVDTLPDALDRMQAALGSAYRSDDWNPIFDAIMETEQDVLKAIDVADELEKQTRAATVLVHPEISDSTVVQLRKAEEGLMASYLQLAERRHIGRRLTLEELLNPVEEQMPVNVEDIFDGSDAQILEEAQQRLKDTAQQQGDASEDESDNDKPAEPKIGPREGLELCAKMEKLLIQEMVDKNDLELSKGIRRLRGALYRKEMRTASQTTLTEAWVSSQKRSPETIELE